MKIYTLLLITLLACSETDPVNPTNQVLQGSFVLTKAVGHQLTDLGGDQIGDPVIIRRVPHTYYYPEGAGSLILTEDTVYMDAPMPLQPIRIKAYLEFDPQTKQPRWRVDNPRGHGGFLIGDLFNFVWIEDTLTLEGFQLLTQNITWDLYWVRTQGS
ncbi:MAG: hypothetical protein OXT74_02585 [Candidatus Poribacteria bacterium]|nr:hypothetical protein [Candidatus Poribacteria bacterium]